VFDGEPDAVVSYVVLVRFFADVDPECLKLVNNPQWQAKKEPNESNRGDFDNVSGPTRTKAHKTAQNRDI